MIDGPGCSEFAHIGRFPLVDHDVPAFLGELDQPGKQKPAFFVRGERGGFLKFVQERFDGALDVDAMGLRGFWQWLRWRGFVIP